MGMAWLDKLLHKTGSIQHGLIGLEFGPDGVAIAQAASTNSIQSYLPGVVRPSAGPLEYCAFHDQPIEAEQFPMLTRLVESRGWQGAPCNVVLHPAQYQYALVSAPDVGEEELHDAMRWHLQDTFGRSPDELAYDAVFMPEDAYRGRGRMAMVAAMPKASMLALAENLRLAGLVLTNIDIVETAMHTITMRCVDTTNPTALLRIRSASCLLTISEGDTLYFSRTLEGGLRAINRHQGDPAATQRALDSLVLEVQRSLDFFESQLRKGSVSHLYVLPTKQQAPAVINALKVGLNVGLSTLPLAQLLPVGDSMTDADMAFCAAAMGAALRRGM